MTDMPIEEAQLREIARTIIQLYKTQMDDYSELIDNYADALLFITDTNLGKATEVVRKLASKKNEKLL